MQINERWYKGGLKLAFVPNAQTANRPIERQRSLALQRRNSASWIWHPEILILMQESGNVNNGVLPWIFKSDNEVLTLYLKKHKPF